MLLFILGFLCGAASMLLVVALYAALVVGGNSDAHMLPVNSNDDGPRDSRPLDPDTEYILADYLASRVGQ